MATCRRVTPITTFVNANLQNIISSGFSTLMFIANNELKISKDWNKYTKEHVYKVNDNQEIFFSCFETHQEDPSKNQSVFRWLQMIQI